MKYNIGHLKSIVLDIINERYDPYNRGYIKLCYIMPNSEDMFIYILLTIGYFYGMIIAIFPPTMPHTIFNFIDICFMFYFLGISAALVIIALYAIGSYLNSKVEEKCDELFNREIKLK